MGAGEFLVQKIYKVLTAYPPKADDYLQASLDKRNPDKVGIIVYWLRQDEGKLNCI